MASDSPVTASSPIQVAKVMSGGYQVVINRGLANGVSNGKRFQIYAIGEEITDPSTGKVLGKVEVVRGTGIVIHAQELIATIQSDMEERGGQKITEFDPPGYSGYSGVSGFPTFARRQIEEPPPHLLPFDNPKVGDFARPI